MYPVVHTTYVRQQEAVIAYLRGNQLHLSVDGQGIEIVSIATDRHNGVASLMKKCYCYIEHQCDVWHIVNSVTQKPSIVGSSSHEFSPLLTTYGGLHKL